MISKYFTSQRQTSLKQTGSLLCVAAIVCCTIMATLSCQQHHDTTAKTFTTLCINKITPVKDQGNSSLCWAYAMLATIESDRLMLGDSVNLSPHYVAREMLLSQAVGCYLKHATDSFSTKGTAPLLLKLIYRHGIMPFDSYRSSCNYQTLGRKLTAITRNIMAQKRGFSYLQRTITNTLDDEIGPLPRQVYMLHAEYTPVEFAHSVCLPGDYVALTSFTHHPFGTWAELEIPDNTTGEQFYNVPIDILMQRIIQALKQGNSVCWEGDISEPGFSFSQGTATLPANTAATQQERQRQFEAMATTDDHCMELIGLAHDEQRHLYFICKNSWGTSNAYHGLMYMSLDYARLKTIAVCMKRE